MHAAKVPSRWASKLGGASAGIMKISEPPYFGVSPAAADAAAPSMAANVAALNATLASRLFICRAISSPSPDSANDVASTLPAHACSGALEMLNPPDEQSGRREASSPPRKRCRANDFA
jgi:hypothetical protein